jgi:hypothetical protein
MAKLRRVLGDFTLVPTVGDDSGVLHAVCFCVNETYRNATTLRERCLIVHRFRSKLADRFAQDDSFDVKYQHADEFESNLRSYNGKIDTEAIDYISIVLKVNIILIHVPEERMLRRGSAAAFNETVVLGWTGKNWNSIVFADGYLLRTPDASHPILDQGQ